MPLDELMQAGGNEWDERKNCKKNERVRMNMQNQETKAGSEETMKKIKMLLCRFRRLHWNFQRTMWNFCGVSRREYKLSV